jgi:hypothetical protein
MGRHEAAAAFNPSAAPPPPPPKPAMACTSCEVARAGGGERSKARLGVFFFMGRGFDSPAFVLIRTFLRGKKTE